MSRDEGAVRSRLLLTVLICTRDRAGPLAKTLESIGTCEIPTESSWEILILDNGSSDNTREVVESFSRTASVRTRYVFEGRPGKSCALNAGIRAARSELILFTDDDVRAAPDWVRQTIQEFRDHPEMAGVGGRVELLDPTAAPIAVRTSRERAIIGIDEVSPMNVPIIGCNMSFRRDVLLEVGGFDENFGPGSPIQATVEEVDLMYRVCLRGHRLVYSPGMLVYHDHGRTRSEELTPIERTYVRGRGAFYWKLAWRGDRRIARCAFREVRSGLGSIVSSLLGRGKLRESCRHLWWLLGGAAAYALRRNRGSTGTA